MILYINACPRQGSGTDRLAKAFLNTLGEYTEIRLAEFELAPLSNEKLEKRTELISQKAFNDDMFSLARQFAAADTIVTAAPYWDGSFPAILKTYIENIYVTGIVSEYGPDGMPVGLCRADRLYYVTTAGGPYDPRFSYEYIQNLAVNMFGIKETSLIYTEFMDIEGNNPDQIIEEKIRELSHG